MSRFKRGNLFFIPGLKTLSLDLRRTDTRDGVVVSHPLRHRELHEGGKRLLKVAGRSGRSRLLGDHVSDVPRQQVSDRLVAVLPAEAFKDIAPGSLCLRGPTLKLRGRIESDHKRVDGARFCPAHTDLPLLRLPLYRFMVCGHELGRPRQARQRHPFEPRTAKIEPRLSMPIDKRLGPFRGSPHKVASPSLLAPPP